jgi:hypothetical protein
VSHEASLALVFALQAAARDSNHRPKALTALRGAEVWVAAWPNDPAGVRMLTNSRRVTALPVFTSERQLEDAAARYGWLGVDGQVSLRRLAIVDAIRIAKRHHAQLIVIDLVADHAFELDEGEMELLSSPGGRSPSLQGLAAVSRTRPPSGPHEVQRISSRPGPLSEPPRHPSEPPRSALQPSSVTPDPDNQSVSATFGASSTATMEALPHEPSDELFEAFTTVLREYPEVEWACVVRAESGHGPSRPSVALRIEPAFRRHLAEISRRLEEVSAEHGEVYEALVLDTPEQMKQARNVGLPFYPWRKKK